MDLQVHRALRKSTGEVVAVKKMNLEKMTCGLDEIVHETATMRAYHHPNVLPLYYAIASRLSGFDAEGMRGNLTLVNSDWTGERFRGWHGGTACLATNSTIFARS